MNGIGCEGTWRPCVAGQRDSPLPLLERAVLCDVHASVAWLMSLQPSLGRQRGRIRMGEESGRRAEFSLWFFTGLKDIAVEMKRCIEAELCRDSNLYGFSNS